MPIRTGPGARRRGLARLILASLAAVVSLAGLAVLTAPAALADDTTTSNEIALRTTFSVPSNSIARDQYIPIPDGLAPVSVRGLVSAQADVPGRLVFMAHNQTIASFPTAVDGDPIAVEFPVSAADVDENGYLVFSIRFLTDAVTDQELVCVVSNYGTAQFTDIVVTVQGREQPPSTIAQFFSPSVRDISVVIPEDPSPELQEAGLAAMAALAYRYPSRETDLSLTTAEDDARGVDPQAIGGRLIEFVPGEGDVVAEVGLRDGVRLLTLTGDPSKLPAAANALGSTSLTAVAATRATGLSSEGHEPVTPELTLDQLGTESVKLVGVGTSITEISVNQAAFGMPVSSFQLHFVGVRSQAPANISAMFSVYWNNALIHSEVFDANTTIDMSIEIPATRIERSNTIQFRMDVIPGGGAAADSGTSATTTDAAPADASVNHGVDCGGSAGILPIEVFIDGKASTVTAVAGQTLTPGFTRLPQMLGNILPVAIGGDAFISDTIADAGLIVSALQRAAPHQLQVDLVTYDEFADSSMSGLIVGASGDEVAALGAPLRMAEFRMIDSNDATFGAGVDQSFAALQAFTSGGREVLSLSSWGPYQPGATVGRLLQQQIAEYVGRGDGGWSGLYSDILIAQVPGAEPDFLNSNSVAPQPERLEDYQPVLLWAAVIVASLAFLFLLGFLARRHVRRRAAKFAEAEARQRALLAPMRDEPVPDLEDHE